MPPSPAFILFVPYYGTGVGEFVRSVTLAEAVAARWPETRIEFLLPGGPGIRRDTRFPFTTHDGPDQARGAFDSAQLERLRPSLVVFDNGCRTETLRVARRLGIRSAYLSVRSGPLRKTFRPDWLWLLDDNWHQRERLTEDALSCRQQFLARCGRTRRLLFDTCYAEAPPALDQLPADVRTLIDGSFVLLSPGGGGWPIAGRTAASLYLDVAAEIAAQRGIPVLTLTGVLPAGSPVDGRTRHLPTVPQQTFRELMRRATVTVTNGGGTLHQAFVQGAACVAAPLGGDDQPGRIAAYAAAGYLIAAEPTVEALTTATLRLLDDAPARTALSARVAALPIVNGIPAMRDRIGVLLGLKP